MTRDDLGYVVSKSLAVWMLFSLLHAIPEVLHALVPLDSRFADPKMSTVLLCMLAIKLAFVIGLWLKAGSFAKWVGPPLEAESKVATVTKQEVASTTLQAVAAYWLIWSLTQLLISRTLNPKDFSTFGEMFVNSPSTGIGLAVLIALSALTLFNAKKWAQRL